MDTIIIEDGSFGPAAATAAAAALAESFDTGAWDNPVVFAAAVAAARRAFPTE